MFHVKKVVLNSRSVFYPKIKELWKIFDQNGIPLFAGYLSQSEAEKYCEKLNLTRSKDEV